MVLFYLTNSALDVTAGVLWWVTKNTVSGVYNGVSYLYGSNGNDNDNDNHNGNDNGNEDKSNDEDLRKQIEILSKSINEVNEQLKNMKNN